MAAQPYSTGDASQNGFVAACRSNGGTTKRLGTRIVQCTLPNGYVIVCNFNPHLCVDFPPLSAPDIDPAGTHGELGGGVIDPVNDPGNLTHDPIDLGRQSERRAR